MKYKIIDGILHEDGKPVFALGASYYPSFFPAKYQVPPEGDRIGEMKKDLRAMKAAGLNWFRTAAIGEVTSENGEVIIRTDFIDEMVKEAAVCDMASSVRLNGYFVNFSGGSDFEMIDSQNQLVPKKWDAFMQACFHHESTLRDSLDATRALAKHFDAFESVVSYQIFNEPHYPFGALYDYHPAAIAAYRKWLVAEGIMSEDEAKDYNPPRTRPDDLSEISEWTNWRKFATESLLNYLEVHAKIAREAAPEKDTYTCYTTGVCSNRLADMGFSMFDDSTHLTTHAMTTYALFEGADYFPASLSLSIAESAAAVSGRRMWVAELDKRTHIPASKFRRETFDTIGVGAKGINYYEWRGDYPGEGTPLPDNCGFIFHDGTPTDSFEDDLRMLALINRHSSEIVTAEKIRSGVAILQSDDSFRCVDALTQTHLGGQNFWIFAVLETFRAVKKYGFVPDLVRASDLAENKLGTKLMLVPCRKYLTEAELMALKAFENAGGEVWFMEESANYGPIRLGGWWKLFDPPQNRVTTDFRGGMELDDVFEYLGMHPTVGIGDRNLFAHTLSLRDGGHLIVLVSNKSGERPIASQSISLSMEAERVLFCTPEWEQELTVENGCVTIPEFSDGAFLFLH